MSIIGKHISHYRIIEKVGRGGMGEVYKAEDTNLKRIVALKFLSPQLTLDEAAKTRFIHEAQAASALQHHNICTIHGIEQTPDGRLFICMDYYSGGTLKATAERGAVLVREAVDLVAQAAEGLAKAHEAGMVHRDVKPANIAVTDDGVVKVLDFGLAMLSDRTRVTKIGTTVGTVSYMSPEQATGGEVTARSDVWSLGVVLYELLAGRLPYESAHEAAVVYAIVNESHVPLTELVPDLPPGLAGIVEQALAKDSGARYGDAGEMARELREILKETEDSGRGATPTGRVKTGGTGGRRARTWISLTVVAAIVMAVLVFKPLLFDGEVVSAPRPIAVISFENHTGDPEYDYLCEVLPNLLITTLEQSKYLSVVTWERMHDLLEQSGRTDVALIDKETGFEACELDGIDTIVLGSFTRAGDVFVTDVKVLDVHSKELLKSVSAKGQGVESILDNQIDELGEEISRGVGLSERSIAETSVRPVAVVTTASMEAYDYFLRGTELLRKGYLADARIELEKAVEIDSTFAAAWLYLAMNYGSLREINNSNAAYERAKSLSASAPERDRLYIDALYAERIGLDDDAYRRAMTELVTRYPKEKRAFYLLGTHYRDNNMFAEAEGAYKRVIELDPTYGPALNGIAYLYSGIGDYEKAIDYFSRYAAAYPDDANPLDSIGEMYFRLGDLDRAIEMCEKALEIKPGFASQLSIAYYLALREDYDGAIARVEQFIDITPSRGTKFAGNFRRAHYQMVGCKWQEAVETLESMKQEAESLGHWRGLAGSLWMASSARHLLGDCEGSRACLDESAAIFKSVDGFNARSAVLSDVNYGLCDLKEGLIDSARTRLAKIDTLLPRVAVEEPGVVEVIGFVAEYYRAEVLLAEGSVDECIEVCRSMVVPMVPTLDSAVLFFYNSPLERDVLARAYVRKGAIDDAIAEYERLVTMDPSSRDRRLIYPLYHYRLARLFEERGTPEKAAAEYTRFLEIVGDADPSIAEVPDARRRLAEFPGR